MAKKSSPKTEQQKAIDQQRRDDARAEFLRLWTLLPERITNAQLANHIGIDPSVISKYLSPNSKVGPSRATLLAMGRFAGQAVRIPRGDGFTLEREESIKLDPHETQLVVKLRAAEKDSARRFKLIAILSILLDQMARPTSFLMNPEPLPEGPGPGKDTLMAEAEAERIHRAVVAEVLGGKPGGGKNQKAAQDGPQS